MKKTKIICAFPACGKTYYFNNSEENTTVLDSDSSKFSWKYEQDWQDEYIRVCNPEFPQNYIEHIKENIGKVDYIFVNAHDTVRQVLNAEGIDFTIVFPEKSLKEEWIGRCFLRDSDMRFCQQIAENWDKWMSEMEKECIENKHNSYILRHGEYLSDAMKYIG